MTSIRTIYPKFDTGPFIFTKSLECRVQKSVPTKFKTSDETVSKVANFWTPSLLAKPRTSIPDNFLLELVGKAETRSSFLTTVLEPEKV